MADGVRELSGADIALSLTGLAGPGGAVPDKPVGLVWLGVSTAKKTYAKKLLLAQHNKPDRAFIRKLAAKNALKNSGKFIPWQVVTISVDGKILD